MIPGGMFTSVPQQADFDPQYGMLPLGLLCKFYGGKAISDPSEGLKKYLWYCYPEGAGIVLEGGRDDIKTVIIPQLTGDVIFCSAAFDSNMRPVIAWQVGTTSYLYFYETLSGLYITKSIDGTTSCAVFTDELEYYTGDVRDVMFFFTDGQELKYEMQRERFATDHSVIATAGEIRRLGRNVVNRLQVQLTGSGEQL